MGVLLLETETMSSPHLESAVAGAGDGDQAVVPGPVQAHLGDGAVIASARDARLVRPPRLPDRSQVTPGRSRVIARFLHIDRYHHH